MLEPPKHGWFTAQRLSLALVNRGTTSGESVQLVFFGTQAHTDYALVAFNDISALGAMTALREAGRKVPEDVSVMGFDDIEFASIAYPALTTIRQPLQEMGATAAELLIRKLANDESVQNIRLRPELIVRSSTCSPSLACPKGLWRRTFKSSR